MTRLNFMFFTPAPAPPEKPESFRPVPLSNTGGDGKKTQDEGVVRAGGPATVSLAANRKPRPGFGHGYRGISLGRAAMLSLGLAIGGSGLAIGVTQLIVWLATGTLPGFTLGQLVSYLIGVSVLPAPGAGQPWYHPGVLLSWFSVAAPASLCLVLLGVWITLKARPERGALPPADATEAVKQIQARLGGNLLVVVSRQRPGLAEYLAEYFAGDSRVEVRIDTRWGRRRARLASQTLPAERRNDGVDAAAGDRGLGSDPFRIFPRG